MARTKGKKGAGKRKQKLDGSKIRLRDLDAKKGRVRGGGFGGFGGFAGGTIKKGQ
jgi:hypothetical protein